jgi:thiol-disulfide isomerase/thioredoxin
VEGIGVAVKRQMKAAVFILLLLALVAGGAAVKMFIDGQKAVNKENLVRRLPDIHFYDQNDRKVTLDDFKGEVVLVNLWATWCPPCVQELPALGTLQAKLKPRGFRVVAIAMDRSSILTVMSFLKEKDVTHLEAYWDKDRMIPQKWQYDGLPTSYLLDREGNVVGLYDGAQEWDKGLLFDRISKLVE